MLEKDSERLVFDNDTTVNAMPNGQSSDSDGDDTDSETSPDGGQSQ